MLLQQANRLQRYIYFNSIDHGECHMTLPQLHTRPVAKSTQAELAERHKHFLAEALHEAERSFQQGGVPVGSVLIHGQKIIGRGHNQRVQKDSAILHGEMDCLMNAGRQHSYSGTTLYTTLSPCMMCAGTIVQFGIRTVVIGENRNFGGNEDFLRKRGVKVLVLNDQDCIRLMEKFIRERKQLWAEDIGRQPEAI
jgi:cytosine deaminase